MWVFVKETNKSLVTTSLLEGETPTEKVDLVLLGSSTGVVPWGRLPV